MMNLATILEQSARNFREKTAIICDGARLSYKELDQRASRVANGLRAAGVEPGQSVALTCPNVAEFPIVYFGIMKAGAVAVPLNRMLKQAEIAYHLADSGAVAYVCYEGSDNHPSGREGLAACCDTQSCTRFWLIATGECEGNPFKDESTLSDLMNPANPPVDTVQRDPNDTCEILYTSGTTGRPKGAELSHASILMNTMVTAEHLDDSHDQIHLVFLPLFHAFAQSLHLNSGLLKGATLVLMPRFEPPAVLRLLEQEKITLFGGVPTMFWALLHCPEIESFDRKRDAPALRYTFTAGQSMPLELAREFEERFDVPVIELYGMSEVSISASNPLKDYRRGSIGLPIWGAEFRIVDSEMNELPAGERGEIVMRGPYVTKGYLGCAEETAEAFRGGWFHSGDVAYRDEDGYLYLVDRIKDVIIRGGENIYPREIEETLVTHPAVSLAAVIGVDDEKFGEEVKAVIVLTNGASLDPEDLVVWSKNKMAKYPRIVEIVDALPTGPTGKILKKQLRK